VQQAIIIIPTRLIYTDAIVSAKFSVQYVDDYYRQTPRKVLADSRRAYRAVLGPELAAAEARVFMASQKELLSLLPSPPQRICAP